MFGGHVKGKVTLNRFREVAAQARPAAARWNKANAEEQAAEERRTVHVITGKTRDSIRVETDGRTGNAYAVAGEGAIYEELGTVNRPPHAFKLPAAERQARRMRVKRPVLYKG